MSAPERIYLQDAGDYSKAAALEVTWCVEPQDDGDTEYIRADAVAEMIRQAVQAKMEACADVVAACADAFAQVAEHPGVDTDEVRRSESILRSIAAAIRARGEV